MRRFDGERNDTAAGGGRGFRVIEAGRYLEPLTPPPPPRAPEPYKVVPPSSSLGRAHRRSSFVIIAETRPATPSSTNRSTNPSPTLPPTGRVSPFRGRGFKGPLPHAQSRPHTPEKRQRGGGNVGRYDEKTGSVSQQNSPKRSLIPQPTRRRSVSLTKNETKASPKFTARAQQPPLRKNFTGTSRANNTVKAATRRYPLKAPDLSPIQGTPTRPNETTVGGRYRAGNSLVAKVSPVKTINNLTVPKFSVNSRIKQSSRDTSPVKSVIKDNRRFVQDNKKCRIDEESKIPVRRGSIVGRNGKDIPSSRFVAENERKTSTRAIAGENDVIQGDSPVTSNEMKPLENRDNGKDEEESTGQNSSGARFVNVDSSVPGKNGKNRENDLSLMDLLKQSSGVVGASSVVNTTTTTAVQPLQFDAAAILLETNLQVAEKKTSASEPSPGSVERSPSPVSSAREMASASKTSKGTMDINEVTDDPSRNKTVDSDDTTATTKPVSSTKDQRDNSTSSNGLATRAEKTRTGETTNSRTNIVPRNGVQDKSQSESNKPRSENSASRVHHSNGNGNSSNDRRSGIAEEKADSAKTETIVADNAENIGNVQKSVASDVVISVDQKPQGRGTVASNDDPLGSERIPSRNVISGKKSARTTNDSSTIGINAVEADDVNKWRVNGSENSLKSSNGLSMVSAESVRSTDTGVSVNTVRGVSSAREKRGMHMMKRSEEIETLSGNIMHLERNGEPASVLDIAEQNTEEPQDQTRLGRLKKSLTRLNDRCPSMRCLGCRKNQKAQSWMGKESSRSREMQRNEVENTVEDRHTSSMENSRFRRAWSSLKNACRCTRLRECKCCRRATRIAPAETTRACCPAPERRCGDLCGRLFSCCRCDRSSESQHTRSIRAKHSLTSVAPPPVTEEQRAKIPEVLVEHNSVMRGAIPCLPVPIAWFCLVWNVLLPGSGTVWSGLFTLCVGQPRFSMSAKPIAKFGALIVNLIVGVGQFFTVLFCLVGWGWSIWWGVTMIRLARKYKRFRASEAAHSDLEARGGDQTGLAAGAPSQALRGMERAR